MKVFVAFGYNERDKWILDIVIPILKAFEIEVETGEEIPGEIIPDEIKKRITNSDAILAFLTLREESGNLTDHTHQWVMNEVVVAECAKLKLIIEVREKGLSIPQGFVNQNRQYLIYNADERELFLVELIKVARRLAEDSALRLMLLPPEFCDEIENTTEERIKCEYRFMEGSRETKWYPGKLLELIAGVGMYVDTSELPRRLDNINVQVLATNLATGKTWRSVWEPLDQRKVTMKPKGDR